ncbi:hypothetical protein M2A_2018 [Tepidicaulis marinus]|uniref:Uncharacterized protein n=1 Tax=Tepidicaulis marinus TaxID=1333998 RepID=A0A081BBV1_9HYPH|nr:hypothetical protein M2A_2018 [Tepidicaulis marinus]
MVFTRQVAKSPTFFKAADGCGIKVLPAGPAFPVFGGSGFLICPSIAKNDAAALPFAITFAIAEETRLKAQRKRSWDI